MEHEELKQQHLALRRDFELLKRLGKQGEVLETKIDLTPMENLINKEIVNTLERHAPPNFPELLFDFRYEFEKFREFILYDLLIGKCVVALGGGFSTGKSSFLNGIIGKNVLPQEIDPSTSVPTYVVQGTEETVFGVNVFQHKMQCELRNVQQIAHGFGEVIHEEEGMIAEEVTLGHILRSLFLSTPLQEYEHIAFLDTPGYSKPGTEGYSQKTDEKIARAQLNSSNYMLWFVQVTDGTLRQEDLRFLQTLHPHIPKLMIVNKADKVPKGQVEAIKYKIREVLNWQGVAFLDVLAFSCQEQEAYEGAKIREYLLQWNQKEAEADFAYNFKILFMQCKTYYEERIDDEGRRLNRLQKALTLTADPTVTQCLTSLVQELKESIRELKEAKEQLKKLQEEFFSEIKRIADVVGIKMPEPSEIALRGSKVKDPLDVVAEYKKQQGLPEAKEMESILQEVFQESIQSSERAIAKKGAKKRVDEERFPHPDFTLGGSLYRRAFHSLLQEELTIEVDPDLLRGTLAYAKAIEAVIGKTLVIKQEEICLHQVIS